MLVGHQMAQCLKVMSCKVCGSRHFYSMWLFPKPIYYISYPYCMCLNMFPPYLFLSAFLTIYLLKVCVNYLIRNLDASVCYFRNGSKYGVPVWSHFFLRPIRFRLDLLKVFNMFCIFHDVFKKMFMQCSLCRLLKILWCVVYNSSVLLYRMISLWLSTSFYLQCVFSYLDQFLVYHFVNWVLKSTLLRLWYITCRK